MKLCFCLVWFAFFSGFARGKSATEWFEEVHFQSDKDSYEQEEWVMVRDLINNKAPSLKDYLNLFASEGMKPTFLEEGNFDAIEEFFDDYVSSESDEQKKALIVHAQDMGVCWLLARKLLDHPDNAELKKELEVKAGSAAKSLVAYQLVTLILEKNELTAELEKTLRSINQIEKKREAALKEAEAGLLFDLTEKKPLQAGGDAPDITVNDLQTGKPFKISELKGQIVYLDFWATWCGPCQKPMSHLNQVAKEHAGDWKGIVQLIGISLDDDSETAMKHLASKGWLDCRQTWPENGFESIAAKKFGIDGIPSAFLINREGKIEWMGHPEEIDLEEKINGLLKNK